MPWLWRTRSATFTADDASACNMGRCTQGVRSNRTGCARGLLLIGNWSQGAPVIHKSRAMIARLGTRLASLNIPLVL
jgi:hypothetical protein